MQEIILTFLGCNYIVRLLCGSAGFRGFFGRVNNDIRFTKRLVSVLLPTRYWRRIEWVDGYILVVLSLFNHTALRPFLPVTRVDVLIRIRVSFIFVLLLVSSHLE